MSLNIQKILLLFVIFVQFITIRAQDGEFEPSQLVAENSEVVDPRDQPSLGVNESCGALVDDDEEDKPPPPKPGLCKCVKGTCTCCKDFKIPHTQQHVNACAIITFLPKTEQIRVVMELCGRVFVNRTIPVVDPPQLCVPLVPEVSSVCLAFTNTSIAKLVFTTCPNLIVYLETVPLHTFHFRCLHWPIPHELPSNPKVNFLLDEEIRNDDGDGDGDQQMKENDGDRDRLSRCVGHQC